MYKITEKKILCEEPQIVLFKIHAPEVATAAKAGQFIIFRAFEKNSERVPLTIADSDARAGTVTLVVQAAGKSTKELCGLLPGDSLQDFAGPLGKPTRFLPDNGKPQRVCVIGGGVGVGVAYPTAKALSKLPNTEVTVITGFRTVSAVIFEDEMSAVSDKYILCTDDGSYGVNCASAGFVTDMLRAELESAPFDRVYAIGPVPMMKAVCGVTRESGTDTVVSLNPIMLDGTGMCGCCRVTVGGAIKFACVDGPEFDGHAVDFDELMSRNRTYQSVERDKRCEECNLLKVAPYDFSEVAKVFTEEEAVEEARYCLGCKSAVCTDGCPVGVPIPQFIEKLKTGDAGAAYDIIRAANMLPAVCGRVCPQENQCEGRCVRGKKGRPVAIGKLERYAADVAVLSETAAAPATPTIAKLSKKVAVIGSGPAGLSCAGKLAQAGVSVTVFEALHRAGGVLVYGIPEFRLPKSVVEREIDELRALGVQFRLNTVIGKTAGVEQLLQSGYNAVFIGSGAGLPMFCGIDGEGKIGVLSANEYLTRVNLMKSFESDSATPLPNGQRVIVIGGGNVAMDAARCAKRLNPTGTVTIVYRRGRGELPARAEEVKHAEEEGVIFKMYTAPVAVVGGSSAGNTEKVSALRVIKTEAGEVDASGRAGVVETAGSEYEIEADLIIPALGTRPNPIIGDSFAALERNRRGCIVTDESGATNVKYVYAGGDAVTGAATVILAMGAGKRAAEAILELF